MNGDRRPGIYGDYDFATGEESWHRIDTLGRRKFLPEKTLEDDPILPPGAQWLDPHPSYRLGYAKAVSYEYRLLVVDIYTLFQRPSPDLLQLAAGIEYPSIDESYWTYAGMVAYYKNITEVVEIYDPETRTFSLTGSLSVPRRLPAAVLLDDGQVLVIGGETKIDINGVLTAFQCLRSGEKYDPITGAFARLATSSVNGCQVAATRLDNGDVLITRDEQAEIFVAGTQSFKFTGKMSTAHGWHHTSTLLDDGRVLITGGQAEVPVSIDVVEVFDPRTQLFSTIDSMSNPRDLHTATLLPNGNVLIAGGGDGDIRLSSAEIFIPNIP